MNISDEMEHAKDRLVQAVEWVEFENMVRDKDQDRDKLKSIITAQKRVIKLVGELNPRHAVQLVSDEFDPEGQLRFLQEWRREFFRKRGSAGHRGFTPANKNHTTKMDYMPALHKFVAEANKVSNDYLAAGDEEVLWDLLEELELTEYYVLDNCSTVLDKCVSKRTDK